MSNKLQNLFNKWDKERKIIDEWKSKSFKELKSILKVGDKLALKNINQNYYCDSAILSSHGLSFYVVITKIPEDCGKFIHGKYYLSGKYMKINLKNINWEETLRWCLKKF